MTKSKTDGRGNRSSEHREREGEAPPALPVEGATRAPVIEEYYQQRLAKAEKLRALGHNPYPNGLRPTHTATQILQGWESADGPALEATPVPVTVAGRVMAVRSFGKAAFLRCMDRTGTIQLFIQRDTLSAADFQVYELLDIGDAVCVSGHLFRTKTNELTLRVETFTIATKALRPLPEKWHGLTDVETRYRQRYVDLIANADVRTAFIRRAKALEAMRAYFVSQDYLEVETPMMHPIPGGATARPFITHHNTLDMDLYLRVAPELYLKRLVVGGLERVFEINRNFRNEGISTQHNPEFTMIEWYESYATFEDQMRRTEEVIAHVCRAVLGTTTVTYQGTEIHFAPPYRRLRMVDAVRDIGKVSDAEVRKADGFQLAELFDTLVQPQLIEPTFITHYPVEISPLARRNDADPSVTDRFELMVYGREIGNAYSELNDPIDQANRMREQAAAREEPALPGRASHDVGGHEMANSCQRQEANILCSKPSSELAGAEPSMHEEAMFYDADYIRALEHGMPPTAGASLGIDRFVMFLTDAPSIRDVILFPLLRPERA